MIGYYKKSIIEILTRIHTAQKEPFENIIKWKIIQEMLLARTFRVEKQIRRYKKEKKDINILRKNPKSILPKEQSIQVKERLKYLEFLINEYTFTLKVFKEIGDSIAFVFINKYDIKPQNFKESAGFMLGKKGYIQEKRCFNIAYRNGLVAIMNDLTNSLKYGDLMICFEDGYTPIEIKSSSFVNSRFKRQMENSEKIFKYLKDDKSNELYDIKGDIRRVQLFSKEVNYIEELNKIIIESKEKGYVHKKMERGLVYSVFYKYIPEEEEIFNIELDEPICHFVNSYNLSGLGYLPFSSSIKDPDAYYSFIRSECFIMVSIDYQVIVELSDEYGFDCEQIDSESSPFCFNFKSKNEIDQGIKSFSVSKHFFSRVFTEFISLEWFLINAFSMHSKSERFREE